MKKTIITKIVLVFSITSIVLVNFSNNVFGKEIVIKNHKAYSHTKQEIIEKYQQALPSFKDSVGYENNPNFTEAPYYEGTLKQSVIEDTKKQVNFYRWLSGLNELELNNDWIRKSQRGALLMKVNDYFSHYQPKPDGIDEAIYTDGEEACRTSNIGWSSSTNCRLAETVLGYINDDHNVQSNVGHRIHLFELYGKYLSAGYCEEYSTIHLDGDSYWETNGNDEDVYAWPVPGYQEATGFARNAMWSIRVADKYIINNEEDLKIKLSLEDKDYQVSPQIDNKNTVYYELPEDFKQELCGSQDNPIKDKEVKIRLEGVVDNNNNDIVIEYTTEFFFQKDVLIDTVTVLNSDDLNATEFYIIDDKNGTITLYDERRETYITLLREPNQTTDSRFIVEATDGSIVEIEDATNERLYDNRYKVYRLSAKGNGETNIVIKREADGKQLAEFKVESLITQTYKLGDVNADNKINVLDCTAILKHIKESKLLSEEEQTRADVNKDNKINVLDCSAILKHIKGTKLIE